MLTKTKQASITNISRCVEHVSRKPHFQFQLQDRATHTIMNNYNVFDVVYYIFIMHFGSL